MMIASDQSWSIDHSVAFDRFGHNIYLLFELIRLEEDQIGG